MNIDTGKEMETQRTERDLRFDFFRGFALICICVNHTEAMAGYKVLGFLILDPTGLYDNAMTFVFISGLMYGYVYEKIYLSHGLWMTWARSIVRSIQIYFFQIVLLPFIIGAAALFLLYGDLNETMEYLRLSPYLHGEGLAFVQYLTLYNYPQFFDILPLYALLLLFMPIFLYGLNRSQTVTVMLAMLVWVQSGFWVVLRRRELLPFHNAGLYLTVWQYLFLLGMMFGFRKRMGTLRLSYSKKYLYPAIAWLLFIFVKEKMLFFINDYIFTFEPNSLSHIPFSLKIYLGPTRIFTFLILVYVVSYFVSKDSKLFQNKFGRALITCGQNSLEVFSFGLFLTYVAIFLMQITNGGYGSMLIMDIGMVLLSVAFAYYLKWRKREPWRRNPIDNQPIKIGSTLLL